MDLLHLRSRGREWAMESAGQRRISGPGGAPRVVAGRRVPHLARYRAGAPAAEARIVAGCGIVRWKGRVLRRARGYRLEDPLGRRVADPVGAKWRGGIFLVLGGGTPLFLRPPRADSAGC